MTKNKDTDQPGKIERTDSGDDAKRSAKEIGRSRHLSWDWNDVVHHRNDHRRTGTERKLGKNQTD